MKKILIIIIGLTFLASCSSKRKTKVTKRQSKIKKSVQDRAKANDEVVFTSSPNEKNMIELEITPKTIFSNQILDDLYSRKPNLQTAKIDYIKKYSVLAIHEMEEFKIPASITLAQGLLESKNGQSFLTKSSKNHFGIKCHKWTGERVYHDDDAKGECFRKYKQAEESYRDHSLFLSTRSRYKKLFEYDSSDYKAWAKGLQKAGYATDRKYPQKLINLIEEYELYIFDKLVLGDDYKPIKKMEPTNLVAIKDNNSKTHIVGVGDTLYDISNHYSVPMETIKKINNLDSETISVGQELKLVEIKDSLMEAKNKSKLDIYIVKLGDTIYSIARKNKITIEALKEKNQLLTDNITIGQKLIIK